jgi:hypothetical protein
MTRVRWWTTWTGRTLALLVTLVTVTGCGGEDMTVASRFGPGLSLDGIGETYAWSTAAQPVGDARLDNPSLHAAIRDAVDEKLQSMGHQRVDAGTADFIVDYRLGRGTRVEGYDGAKFTEHEHGAIVIDLVAPGSGDLIWRGSAQAQINPDDPPSVRRNRVKTAVDRVLGQLAEGAG